MSQTINKDELKKTIVFNVKSIYRKTIDEATPAMVYQAVALAVKDIRRLSAGVPAVFAARASARRRAGSAPL